MEDVTGKVTAAPRLAAMMTEQTTLTGVITLLRR
jgi:hypothetical protein